MLNLPRNKYQCCKLENFVAKSRTRVNIAQHIAATSATCNTGICCVASWAQGGNFNLKQNFPFPPPSPPLPSSPEYHTLCAASLTGYVKPLPWLVTLLCCHQSSFHPRTLTDTQQNLRLVSSFKNLFGIIQTQLTRGTLNKHPRGRHYRAWLVGPRGNLHVELAHARVHVCGVRARGQHIRAVTKIESIRHVAEISWNGTNLNL